MQKFPFLLTQNNRSEEIRDQNDPFCLFSFYAKSHGHIGIRWCQEDVTVFRDEIRQQPTVQVQKIMVVLVG
jgi:hypothetical protein